MDEQIREVPQTPIRRRRKPRSKMQIFKESYLPVIIAGASLLLIIIFVIGSISRAVAKNKADRAESIKQSQEAANAEQMLKDEAQRLLDEAAYLAAGYDFEGAIATLNSFQGDIAKFPELANKRAEYEQSKSQMTVYNDISAIPNLSFQLLIADPERAFSDAEFSSAYKNNFITVSEFKNILQALYNNNYMLVNLQDLVTTTVAEDGSTVFTAKPLYLPADKKPFMLTETQVNYYTYMVDSDSDGLADKDGAGFASKLVVDAQGKLVNEYIDTDGNVLYGAYDMVPILEEFIAQHPDFSLRGARATVAVTGYDRLFGYRTTPAAAQELGTEAYQTEIDGVLDVVDALQANGYSIACYTYENISYGDASATEIQADLKKWNEQVTPILGNTAILVYARNSDIADTASYSGDRYQVLKDAGFRYFLGYSSSAAPWATVENDYVRIKRIMITGTDLVNNPQIYSAYFNASEVLDAARNG